MARPRKPSNVLELTGAFKQNPQRRRVDPEAAGPIKKHPDYLKLSEISAWKEIIKCSPAGVITESDRLAVEIASCLMAEFRESPIDMHPSRLARLCALLGQLGMTPADRSKIGVKASKKQDENPFASL